MYTNDFQNCSRGVLIYVQNTIKSKQLFCEKPLQEVVTVEIEGKKDTLTISNIIEEVLIVQKITTNV